jgi:hypothetical protein
MVKDTSTRDAEVMRRVKVGESEREISVALDIPRSTVWGIKQRAAAAAEADIPDAAPGSHLFDAPPPGGDIFPASNEADLADRQAE